MQKDRFTDKRKTVPALRRVKIITENERNFVHLKINVNVRMQPETGIGITLNKAT